MLQRKIPKSKTILHSIPIGSIMVLLLLLSFLISPNIYYSNNSVYAVEEDNIEGHSNNSDNSDYPDSSNSSETNIYNNIENSNNSSVSTYTNNSDGSDISTQANVTTASATLSIDNNANGTSYSEPGETIYRTHNVDVHVNDVTSYNLSISYGADANNTLNYEGSSKNPPTITGANNLKGNSLENNTWGYYWDTNNSTDTSILNYSTMPNYNASETILTESNSNNIAYNKTINGKLIFAAKFAEDAPYGHYKTSVLLSLAATPQNITTYNVTYNCNGGTNCPENFSTESTELTYTYTIPNITPTKEGYTFLGYSTSSGSTTVEYNPNSTISLNSSSPSRELFVVWKKNNPLEDITYMQDMTSELCANASIGDSTILTDSRDNNTYTIQKLEDGRCWMTQNLRIVNKKITSANSNLEEGASYTIPASSSSGWSTNSGNYSAQNVLYNNNTNNGAYYTWWTATAYSDSNYDICPKQWKMPTNAEYATVISKDGGWDTTRKGKIFSGGFFPAAGDVYGGSLQAVNTVGFYWSIDTKSDSYPDCLSFQEDRATAAIGQFSSIRGHSVRCIAR